MTARDQLSNSTIWDPELSASSQWFGNSIFLPATYPPRTSKSMTFKAIYARDKFADARYRAFVKRRRNCSRILFR